MTQLQRQQTQRQPQLRRQRRSVRPQADTRPSGGRPGVLKVIPLGGVGEIGKNCTLLEYGDDMVLIDAGAAFPGDDEPGVDLLVPDVSYVREHARRLRAIVLTHGHEDHIGGLAFVAEQIGLPGRIPLYGSALALGLARGRLEERKAMRRIEPRPIGPGQRIKLGGLNLEFVPVGHSIPDAYAIVVHSAVGPVIYTGDWKFADMPSEGRDRLQQLGREGVTALLADCVRIESPGHTPPESVVAASIERLMRESAGRLIVTTFASNIKRVADTIATAHRLGRASALIGRSMVRNIGVAGELGVLDIPQGALIQPEDARKWPAGKLVLITTGSQGEPTAALSRIAAGDHRQIRIQRGDTVIIAASPIPGNEETVSRTIDNLFRLGADVHYPRITPDIHVSGHAAREDHADLLDLLRPKFVAPFHGEYRMMELYSRLALEVGVPRNNVLMPELGSVLEITRRSARRHGTVPSGRVLVDGLTVGVVTGVVLRDRRVLAAEGLLVISVVLDRQNGRLVSPPDLVARGLPEGEHSALLDGARSRVIRTLERRHRGMVEPRHVHDLIKEAAASHILHEAGLRPMVVPVVTEV